MNAEDLATINSFAGLAWLLNGEGRARWGQSNARSGNGIFQLHFFFLDSSGGDGEINTRTQQTWVAAYAWISTSVKTLVKDIQS